MLAQTTRQLVGPDWFILISYFVVMLGIGLYFFRFMRGMKDFFTGGNRIPWWLSGVSYWMSSFSAFAFVSYSALAYKYGMYGVTVYWVTVPATLFSLVFFARRWRRARVTSPVEYLETRYSPALRQVFAWQGIPVKLIDDALKIVAIGGFISVTLGVSIEQAMFWSSIIMLAYTFMGGLWAVMVTDFVQFVVMMAAVLVLFPLAFGEAGGLIHFFQTVPPERLRLTTPEYDWIFVVGLILMYSLSYSVNWSLVQRFYSVPAERDARKVGWMVVVLNIIGPPLMFAPAMAAWSFLGEVPDRDVYPLMCAKLLPAGMFGLVIAAMFAAAMSMLSSDYNVCASVLTNDVYKRLIRPDASNRQLVIVGRLMTLLVGVISLGLAFTMVEAGGEDLFKNMVALFSVATAPVAVPMLLGLVSRRVSNGSAIVGFCVGLAVGISLFFFLMFANRAEFQYLGVTLQNAATGGNEVRLLGIAMQDATFILVCSLITTSGALLISLPFFPMNPAQQQRVDEFQTRLATPIGQIQEDNVAPDSGTTFVSPFRIVGVTVAIAGAMMLAVLPWVKALPDTEVHTGPLAFKLNLIIGSALLILGAVMVWTTRKRPAQAASSDS